MDNTYDAAGSARLKPAGDSARHTLTVRQVAQLLIEAGVPRSERRIKYFCQMGTLDAGLLPSPTGDQWYVSAASVPGLVGELRQFDEQVRRRKQQAAAGSSTHQEPLNSNPAAAGSSLIEPAASELKHDGAHTTPQPAAAGFISQLEKRIEEKDQTIKFLQEELVDRRAQIGGMKAIIDGQRQLLETINNNVAPVFGALAQLVRGRSADSETITATMVDGAAATSSVPPTA